MSGASEVSADEDGQFDGGLPAGHHFSRWLGIEVSSQEPGLSVGSLTERAEILNYRSVLHGGVLTTLADVTMANAVGSQRADGMVGVTNSLHITFLRPARGTVHSHGRALRVGSRSGYAEVEITDSDGTIVAHAVGYFTFLSASSPQLRLPGTGVAGHAAKHAGT